MNFLLRTDSGVVRQHKFAHISIAAQTFPSFLKRIFNELPFSINYRFSWSRLHHNSVPGSSSLIIGQWVCPSFLLVCRPAGFIQLRKWNEVENRLACSSITDGNAGKLWRNSRRVDRRRKIGLFIALSSSLLSWLTCSLVFNNSNQQFMEKMLTLHYRKW